MGLRSPVERFRILVLLLCAGVLVAELVNGRFWLNDLRVYYDSARAMLDGEPVFGVARGLDSGVYKYSPAFLVLIAPLTVLPYTLAAVLFFGLITLAIARAFPLAWTLLERHALPAGGARTVALFLTLLVTLVHLHRELHLGNVNMLLLLLLLFSLDRMMRSDGRGAGLALGAALLVKPHFLVLVPLLVLYRRWSVLGHAMAAVVLGSLLPMVLTGPGGWVTLQQDWIGAMRAHNAAPVYLGGDAYEAVNTVYSLVQRGLLAPLGIGYAPLMPVAVLGVVAVGALLLVLRSQRVHGTTGPAADRDLLLLALLLIGAVPLLTVTDTEHFLFAMPVVMLALRELFLGTTVVRRVVLITALFLYGGNWGDALGPLSDPMAHAGMLGLGTALLVTLIAVHAPYRDRTETPS